MANKECRFISAELMYKKLPNNTENEVHTLYSITKKQLRELTGIGEDEHLDAFMQTLKESDEVHETITATVQHLGDGFVAQLQKRELVNFKEV